MNFRLPLVAIRTVLAKDERQNRTSLVGVIFGFETRRTGNVIGVLKGGVTGYEQFGWNNGHDSDAKREDLHGDLCVNAGTVGSWDRLVIPASEMQRFWTAYDAHAGGTQYREGRDWIVASMRCFGTPMTDLVDGQLSDVLDRAQNGPPDGPADGSINEAAFEALRKFHKAFRETIIHARRYWTAGAAKTGGIDFARRLREHRERQIDHPDPLAAQDVDADAEGYAALRGHRD